MINNFPRSSRRRLLYSTTRALIPTIPRRGKLLCALTLLGIFLWGQFCFLRAVASFLTYHPSSIQDFIQEDLSLTVQHVEQPRTFHPEWHPLERHQRFPSVQQRVQLYMSTWYTPLCTDAVRPAHQFLARQQQLQINYSKEEAIRLDTKIRPDRLFFLDYNSTKNCSGLLWHHLHDYCEDGLQMLQFAQQNQQQLSPQVPLVVRYGDSILLHSLQLPFFAKFRPAANTNAIQSATQQNCSKTWNGTAITTIIPYPTNTLVPIVWNLNSARHWGNMNESKLQDTNWHDKKHGSLWRGALTGPWQGSDDFEKCQANLRCNFVWRHANSTRIHAGLTRVGQQHTLGPQLIHLLANESTLQEIQSYKVIVSLEGNDVASGLKWALWSQSVVLMPTPTKTSWAMEELLEPWVHYIPMLEDGSNAEEMIEWVRQNDESAQRIAERGTLFVHDFLYHEDSPKDDVAVKNEILRRYQKLWLP